MESARIFSVRMCTSFDPEQNPVFPSQQQHIYSSDYTLPILKTGRRREDREEGEACGGMDHIRTEK
ncbi:hypothetical protein JCM10550A_08970 [Methanogenium cariaci]